MNPTLVDRLAAAGLRVLTAAARVAPGPTERLIVALCDAMSLLMPGTRATVAKNLLPFCDGDNARARRLARQVFRNVGRYYVDLCRLPSIEIGRFTDERILITPRERIPVITEPGPVIIISAHWGTPEISLQACLPFDRPFLAVVERLGGERLREQMRLLRQSQGGVFVDADYPGLREALAWLRRGEAVAFVADRDIVGNGVWVTLAGRSVRMARGPFQLAQRTGARIVPVFTPRRGRFLYTAEIGEGITISRESGESGIMEAAQAFASLVEEHIRRAPGQWTVLQPYWEQHDCGKS